MKILILISTVVASQFISSAIYGQSESAEQGKFAVEIQPAAEGGPKFRVANLASKSVRACVIQFSVSSEGRPQSHMDWDAIVQGGRDPRRGGQQLLKPGASMTINIPYSVEGPLPDKTEMVAAIWDDGETLGEAKWLKVIPNQRASLASAYDQAISLLQQGLDEKWIGNQYLTALNGKPNSISFLSICATVQANSQLDEESRSLQRALQNLLGYFTRYLALLRQTKRRLAPSPLQSRSSPDQQILIPAAGRARKQFHTHALQRQNLGCRRRFRLRLHLLQQLSEFLLALFLV